MENKAEEVDRDKAFTVAQEMIAAVRAAPNACGLLLTHDDDTDSFRMVGINASELDTVQLLVIAMESMRDIHKAQNESALAAQTGGLN
jgi:hypothetical protein